MNKGGVYVEITKDMFNEVGRKIKKAIPAGLELGGMGVERTAKQDAHVDTGRYRSSIGHSENMLTSKGSARGITINPSDAIWNLTEGIGGIWLFIGTNVEYAPDLEAKFGTLFNALMKSRELILVALREALKGSIIL